MQSWEYCEIYFDGSTTYVYHYDEAGDYIDHPTKHPRLGIKPAELGHDGWELVSTWWRDRNKVTYMLKRPCDPFSDLSRMQAREKYRENHPRDAK